MTKEFEPQTDTLKEQFSELRNQVHAQEKREIKERKEKNPSPTDQEIYLGAFAEEIEPQVRDAVFKLLEKGYELTQSGFRGIQNPDVQFISGYFSLEDDTKGKLRSNGR